MNYGRKSYEKGTLNDGYDPRMEALHIENAERLDEIIENHEWPGQSLVGMEGSDAAFMIACHSISQPRLQRKFSQHIQDAVKNEEATQSLRQLASKIEYVLTRVGRSSTACCLLGMNQGNSWRMLTI